MLFLFALLACVNPTETPAPEVESEAVLEPNDAAPVAAEDAPPVGSIGGEPILPQVIVMGGISTADVEAGIAQKMNDITDCYQSALAGDPGLAGKVLVKFTIDKAGAVASTVVRSTSLRHPAAEACLTDVVAQARFPALQSGRLAIVHYPFGFPMEGTK